MGNTKYTKEQIRERIQQKKILFDSSFWHLLRRKIRHEAVAGAGESGGSGAGKGDPQRVSGSRAQILRTNTFAANSFCMDMFPGNRSERHCAVGFDWQGKQWYGEDHRRDERDLHSGGHWPDSRGGHGTERCFKQRI